MTSTTKWQPRGGCSVTAYARFHRRARELPDSRQPPRPTPEPCKALPSAYGHEEVPFFFSPLPRQKRCSPLARCCTSGWVPSSAAQRGRPPGSFMEQTRGLWDGWMLWQGLFEQILGWAQRGRLWGLSAAARRTAAFYLFCGHSLLGKNALSSTDQTVVLTVVGKSLEKCKKKFLLSGSPLKSANSR